MNKLFKKTNKAFTITELVIVIAVIAILAAVLIPTFSSVINNSKVSAAMQDCKNFYVEYNAECKVQQVTTRNGIIFEKNDVYFTNTQGTIKQVKYLGDNTFSDDTYTRFIVGVISSAESETDETALYEIPSGTYSFYSLETDGGQYVYWVNKTSSVFKKDLGGESKGITTYFSAYSFYATNAILPNKLSETDFSTFMYSICTSTQEGKSKVSASFANVTSMDITLTSGADISKYEVYTDYLGSGTSPKQSIQVGKKTATITADSLKNYVTGNGDLIFIY